MNEVSTTVLTTQLNVRSASSKGAENTQGRVNGEKLPSAKDAAMEAVKEKQIKAEAEKDLTESREQQSLEAAVATINDYVQVVQRDLHFSVDEDLDQTIVKVVDSHSGELIRQIPEEVFLDLARKLKEDGELHLVNALG